MIIVSAVNYLSSLIRSQYLIDYIITITFFYLIYIIKFTYYKFIELCNLIFFDIINLFLVIDILCRLFYEINYMTISYLI